MTVSNWHRNSKENEEDLPRYRTNKERSNQPKRDAREAKRVAQSTSQRLRMTIDLELDPTTQNKNLDKLINQILQESNKLFHSRELVAHALGITAKTLRKRLKEKKSDPTG